MTTNKTTYKTVLTKVIEGKPLTAEDIDKAKALLASIEKKSGAERKPTATQVANIGLTDAIVAHLTATEGRETVSSLLKTVDAVAGMSNQKVSALCRAAVETGRLFKVVDKRTTYFTAINPGEGEGD